MNTSNGFNSIQMFTAFLPEDFQIISQGQMKPALGRCLSPPYLRGSCSRGALQAAGWRSGAEQCGAVQGRAVAPAHRGLMGGRERLRGGCPRAHESRLLRRGLTRRVRQPGLPAPVAID